MINIYNFQQHGAGLCDNMYVVEFENSPPTILFSNVKLKDEYKVIEKYIRYNFPNLKIKKITYE